MSKSKTKTKPMTATEVSQRQTDGPLTPTVETKATQESDAARFAKQPDRPAPKDDGIGYSDTPIEVNQIGNVLDQSVGLTPSSPVQSQVPSVMPQSTTPVATGQYQDAPNTSPDPISGAIKDPSASLMPDAPATLVAGKIVSISIEAAEFEDRRGSLDYIVRVNVGGESHVIRKQIGIHHFRGYFATVWNDLGEHFKRAVEAATN